MSTETDVIANKLRILSGVAGEGVPFGVKAEVLLATLEAAGFRVVSADAVVLNRDDIPERLLADLEDVPDCCDHPHGLCDQCLGAVVTAARLLSGGSPAAPEDGTDG